MKPRDFRFYQLFGLSLDGDEEAIHDLWLEYEFDARRAHAHQLPPTEEEQRNTNKMKE